VRFYKKYEDLVVGCKSTTFYKKQMNQGRS